MRAVIYARHSTHLQTTSSEDQIRIAKEQIKFLGYDLCGVYTDEAISGKYMVNRPGIQKLIEDAFAKDFDVVICEDLSRISRRQGDIDDFYQRMVFLDIIIETINEGVINELHIGLKGTMNALYLKDTSDKTKRGMVSSVLKGRVPGGRIYGYDIVRSVHEGELIRGQRKINEEEANIIRKIFYFYDNDRSINFIVEYLNNIGSLSPTGRKWNFSTIAGNLKRQTGILRQTLYKGVITFNKVEYRKHPDTGRRISFLRPEEEWIYTPAPELAIIDEKLFDRIQAKFKERSDYRKTFRKNEGEPTKKELAAKREKKRIAMENLRRKQERIYLPYITSNNIHCPHCRIKMILLRGGVYGCPHKVCANRNIKRDQLISTVQRELAKFDPEILSRYNRPVKRLYKRLVKQLDALEEKFEQEQSKIVSLLETLGNQKYGTQTKRFLEKAETSCHRLALEIREVKKKVKIYSPVDKDEISTINKRFIALCTRAKRFPDDLDTIIKLSDVIDKITVEKYVTGTRTYDLVVNITYNVEKIVTELRNA